MAQGPRSTTADTTKPGHDRLVYCFGAGRADGDSSLVALLGGKGAGLADMSRLGLPVPPGFTITTEACLALNDRGSFPERLADDVDRALAEVEKSVGRRFGDSATPLLVAVRAGARIAMPRMTNTVLNVGLNAATVEGLVKAAGERFALDSYRRFIQMYADAVLGIDAAVFEDQFDAVREQHDVDRAADLTPDHLRVLIERHKAAVIEETGAAFPEDPRHQLWGAIDAVCRSWHAAPARAFRALHRIPDEWGTAVTVQAMVFGNQGPRSGTGVASSRDPATGRKALCGEFLAEAQGEDVLLAMRPTAALTSGARHDAGSTEIPLQRLAPAAFEDLQAACETLERHYLDVQDVEFTVEDGRLWMLQTRPAKPIAAASIRIAVEMAMEGMISRDEALMRIDPAMLDQLLHRSVDPSTPRDVFATGLPASPGAASGEIVFSAEEAKAARAEGRRVVLVRTETSPEDVHGMQGAEAILTSRGGLTSHAAMVARGMGKPCISGAGGIRIDAAKQTMRAGGRSLSHGDWVTIDGSRGEILVGVVATRQPELSAEFAQLMDWADARRILGVRANAETPEDAEAALRFGAEGIGLCRSEQMFFAPERRPAMLEMILAETVEARRTALQRLLPMQRQDFLALFRIMRGRPVTIRLIDPPLHEFLPRREADIVALAASTGMAIDLLRQRIEGLAEFNPMLGHRGVRLAITYPEIVDVQTRAALEAALDASNAMGVPVSPEILVPLVLDKSELDIVVARIALVAEAVAAERGTVPSYTIGTMIELPRAALRAGSLAESADFFSFGTNDLTQTTLGISRDDSSTFLGRYTRAGIFARDPFVTIDREGVGELVRMAVARGRETRPDLKLGACGEHAGDPESIAFFAEAGLDYVSSSPYRVPIARLAAAQAAIRAQS